MPDYAEMILARQDMLEILEDDPDTFVSLYGDCWWDDIPEEEFYEHILN